MSKIIEVVSVGFDETCVLKIDGKEVCLTADDVQEIANIAGDVCYTMGFKSGITPEEYEKAQSMNVFWRLVDSDSRKAREEQE